MAVVRSLAFDVPAPPELEPVFRTFRLAANQAIRHALKADARSRGRFHALGGYHGLANAHQALFKMHLLGAIEVALGVLKNHRRRVRKGRTSVPYVKRLFLRTENQAYQLNRTTGHLRIPLGSARVGGAARIDLPLSQWHRRFLEDPAWRLGCLTVTPSRILLAVRREAPPVYAAESGLALDTNEDALDGVLAQGPQAIPLQVSLRGARQVQQTHFRRRRHLARKKAHDRRTQRTLLNREGRRERARVGQRLHLVSKALVRWAAARNVALVLEDLKGFRRVGRGRTMNRRLSSWPFRQLHRQIGYKAELAGVPVVRVNPFNTSKTCPACGAIPGRRERTGKVFECACGWRLDRQQNAALNILKTALAGSPALARAVWFRPGAPRQDPMSPLCDAAGRARDEANGRESKVGVVTVNHPPN